VSRWCRPRREEVLGKIEWLAIELPIITPVFDVIASQLSRLSSKWGNHVVVLIKSSPVSGEVSMLIKRDRDSIRFQKESLCLETRK
jgi:hypothetical protein